LPHRLWSEISGSACFLHQNKLLAFMHALFSYGIYTCHHRFSSPWSPSPIRLRPDPKFSDVNSLSSVAPSRCKYPIKHCPLRSRLAQVEGSAFIYCLLLTTLDISRCPAMKAGARPASDDSAKLDLLGSLAKYLKLRKACTDGALLREGFIQARDPKCGSEARTAIWIGLPSR
jgi:hypothetical protein